MGDLKVKHRPLFTLGLSPAHAALEDCREVRAWLDEVAEIVSQQPEISAITGNRLTNEDTPDE